MLNFKQWKINQILAGCVIAFGGFGFGSTLAWTATALPNLEKSGTLDHLNQTKVSWIASAMTIGALVACPITGLFLRDVGRKTGLIGFSSIAFAGWILLATASDPTGLCVGRSLLGAATGGYTILVPIFVGEISSQTNRGLIGSLFLIMLCVGKLFSNVAGVLLPIPMASLLCSLHSIVYIFLLLLIPESPKILAKQNNMKAASISQAWYEAKGISCSRGTNLASAAKVSLNIGAAQSTQTSNTKSSEMESEKSLGSVTLLIPLITVLLLMMLSQFSGINISTFYTVEIFRLSGDHLVDPEKATILLALVQLVGCLPCTFLVDKYGRRLLLISGFVTMAIAMACLSAFFYLKSWANFDSIQEQYPQVGLVPMASLILYNLAYSWGVGSVVWIIASEIIPRRIVGPASAIANIVFWGSAFIITQSFQMFKTQVPLIWWFAGFAVASGIGVVFTALILPETKGLSVEEIQAFYDKSDVKSGVASNPNSNKA